MYDKNEMARLAELLCTAYGPSGREEYIRELIKKELDGAVDEFRVDALGNLIAIKRCGKPDAKRLMLAAHMDEIGVIVAAIDDKGFCRFQAVGGVSQHRSVARVVRFENGTRGVIYAESIDEIGKLEERHLYIDLGVTSREEAEKLVSVGDFACFEHNFYEMGNNFVTGALDDRLCCAMVIAALREVKNPQSDIYAVFTAQEEVGIRGAQTAAYAIDPHVGIALDVTASGDTPEFKPAHAMAQGKGACIKVKDRSVLCHPAVKDWMTDVAKANDIPFQYEVLAMGGTDAGAMAVTRAGVPSGCISVATRYIHSSFESANADDVLAGTTLLARLMEDGLPV